MSKFEILKLANGQKTIVDRDDYEWAKHFSWYMTTSGYAYHTTYEGKGKSRKHIAIPLHRIINQTPAGLDTDHINGDRLDNRKSNLRTVTRSQNLHNTKRRKDNKSGIIGVNHHDKNNSWRARIRVNYKEIDLGCFKTIDEAIVARKNAEAQYVRF